MAEALGVCVERLEAASRLPRYFAPTHIMHVRIEHIAEDPRKWFLHICHFADIDAAESLLLAAHAISLKALNTLGSPCNFFSMAEQSTIEQVRTDLNSLFEQPLV